MDSLDIVKSDAGRVCSEALNQTSQSSNGDCNSSSKTIDQWDNERISIVPLKPADLIS